MQSREASQAIQEEERYRLLVDAIIDYAVYMLDPEGTVVSWNSGAQRFKGYTASEIIGSHFSAFYTEEDRVAGLPARGLATATEQGRFETEGWRVRKDGSQFWGHVVIDPIRSEDGLLLGFAKVTRDLTKKRLAEVALRDSEEQLKRLIQGVKDHAIYLLSANGHVTNWNVGAQRIKGYAPEEIIGEHFSRFYTAEDRAAGRPSANLAAAERDGHLEEEGWRVRKDGSPFMAHVVIDAIRDDEGQLTGFTKVTRDVTERYETQKALERAREELFQAQKMEAVGRLTGGVAHDFNNLLTVILISLNLARKRLGSSPVVQLINNAIQGAERGATMTQRMLAFSRRQSLQLEPVSIPELVFGMHTLVRQSTGSRILVDTKFALGLPCVRADAHQLETALLNIVLNAWDAMPDGGNIEISARVSDSLKLRSETGVAQQCVLLEITDSGEGMDDETLEKAIEPFFTTKGVGKGTGLGLSMVHGVVEQLGGRLRLKSAKGSGTTVQLWLPVADTDQIPANPVERKEERPSTQSLRVLIVDDDDLVLINSSALLEELGHRAIRAESADQALKVLTEIDVDLVITDHSMPGMTGSQLIERLAQSHPALPVVLASGYAELSGHADPAVLMLSKPFNEAELSQAITKAISRYSSFGR